MEENRKKVPFYNQIEKYMIVSMFLVMTVIIALNVVTRFVFNFTLSWGEQLARLLLVWTSFAGISWAGMINAHMRVTALSLAFKKNPKIFEIIYLLGDIVAVIYGFYLSWQIFGVMILVKNQGQVLSALPLVPKWIMYLAGVLGMAGMSIRIIQRRVGEFRGTEQE
ncbi:TRAP transporter small permease [Clostridium sp. AM33-3]|jgi:C4-dicarboxylate transporter DctQ subunit|uniref:TRAP transporter small permease n=1 Tax=Clostridium sp. AM33-3 TaxID=2292304 RepID=UPI000E47529A|nr:TRAP transporter small permease [Clostridium sp. AM33-3]RHT24052.1 TRAP transporter small permease [Clostridium sp. AM33-3]